MTKRPLDESTSFPVDGNGYTSERLEILFGTTLCDPKKYATGLLAGLAKFRDGKSMSGVSMFLCNGITGAFLCSGEYQIRSTAIAPDGMRRELHLRKKKDATSQVFSVKNFLTRLVNCPPFFFCLGEYKEFKSSSTCNYVSIIGPGYEDENCCFVSCHPDSQSLPIMHPSMDLVLFRVRGCAFPSDAKRIVNCQVGDRVFDIEHYCKKYHGELVPGKMYAVPRASLKKSMQAENLHYATGYVSFWTESELAQMFGEAALPRLEKEAISHGTLDDAAGAESADVGF